jgi:dUTPase
MLLTKNEIANKGIVLGAQPAGVRETTYDATVGTILSDGSPIAGNEFTLKSRGVVWVVSAEEFRIPSDNTGVATLRTSWAHEGVFALNVGLLDPGWKGPVATALVNFGKKDFVVRKGEGFLRVLFLTSAMTAAQPMIHPAQQYIKTIGNKSLAFSDTFLNMSSLVAEVEKEVLKMPKWALYLALAAIILSVFAVYAPISYTIFTDHLKDQVALSSMEKRVAQIEAQMKETANPLSAGDRSKTAKPNAPTTQPPSNTTSKK